MNKRIDLTGQRFHRLYVLKEIEPARPPNGKPKRRYLCKCDCGKEVLVTSESLRNGKTKSCRCWNNDRIKKDSTTHGHSINRRISSTYRSWSSMITRCTNPKSKDYKRYGARGIKVCDRWLNSFENFLKDMGEKPKKGMSIDRINSKGNYEPDNCRWATPKEQANNMSRNVLIPDGDQHITMAQFSRKYKIPYRKLQHLHIRKNKSIEEIISKKLWETEVKK